MDETVATRSGILGYNSDSVPLIGLPLVSSAIFKTRSQPLRAPALNMGEETCITFI